MEEHSAEVPHMSPEEAVQVDAQISAEMKEDSAVYSKIAAVYKTKKQSEVTKSFLKTKLREKFNWSNERIKEEEKKKKATKRVWADILWGEIEAAANDANSQQ